MTEKTLEQLRHAAMEPPAHLWGDIDASLNAQYAPLNEPMVERLAQLKNTPMAPPEGVKHQLFARLGKIQVKQMVLTSLKGVTPRQWAAAASALLVVTLAVRYMNWQGPSAPLAAATTAGGKQTKASATHAQPAPAASRHPNAPVYALDNTGIALPDEQAAASSATETTTLPGTAGISSEARVLPFTTSPALPEMQRVIPSDLVASLGEPTRLEVMPQDYGLPEQDYYLVYFNSGQKLAVAKRLVPANYAGNGAPDGGESDNGSTNLFYQFKNWWSSLQEYTEQASLQKFVMEVPAGGVKTEWIAVLP